MRDDGLVCGEGAGVLVLEDYEHARQRGADIYGEIAGYSTCASGTHLSESSREGMRACMDNAIQDSGLKPEQVDYISTLTRRRLFRAIRLKPRPFVIFSVIVSR